MDSILETPDDRPYKRRRLNEGTSRLHSKSQDGPYQKSVTVASLLCSPLPDSDSSSPFNCQPEEWDVEGQYWHSEASPLSAAVAASQYTSPTPLSSEACECNGNNIVVPMPEATQYVGFEYVDADTPCPASLRYVCARIFMEIRLCEIKRLFRLRDDQRCLRNKQTYTKSITDFI